MIDSRIYLYDFDSAVSTDISVNGFNIDDEVVGTNDIDPRFSPNNGKIICVNRYNELFNEGEIITMDKDGLNREVIIDSGLMPDWN